MKMKVEGILISIACSTIFYGMAGATTNGQDVYENIHNCPFQRSGPDCSIPFEQCKDGIRKCFNNSVCIKDKKNNPITGDVMYGCDCSFATGISDYAGYECEHSATVRCQEGDHFCGNGGACGSYVINHQHYVGCHCPPDFAGKHCQYLKITLNEFLEGEARIPEVADDFYAVPVITVKESTNVTTFFLVIGFVALTSTVVYITILKRHPGGAFHKLKPTPRVLDSAKIEGEFA